MWVNALGQDKWADIKYERISDYCYGCGRLGHSSQTCAYNLVMSESKIGFPMYGSWLSAARPIITTRSYIIGEEGGMRPQQRSTNKRTWRDVMHSVSGVEKAVAPDNSNAYAESGKSRNNHPAEVETEGYTGRSQNVFSGKRHCNNPQSPRHNQTSFSSSNARRGTISLLDLNEILVEHVLFPTSIQPDNPPDASHQLYP